MITCVFASLIYDGSLMLERFVFENKPFWHLGLVIGTSKLIVACVPFLLPWINRAKDLSRLWQVFSFLSTFLLWYNTQQPFVGALSIISLWPSSSCTEVSICLVSRYACIHRLPVIENQLVTISKAHWWHDRKKSGWASYQSNMLPTYGIMRYENSAMLVKWNFMSKYACTSLWIIGGQ